MQKNNGTRHIYPLFLKRRKDIDFKNLMSFLNSDISMQKLAFSIAKGMGKKDYQIFLYSYAVFLTNEDTCSFFPFIFEQIQMSKTRTEKYAKMYLNKEMRYFRKYGFKHH
ncbi:hypothetical protein AD998_02050 [bacterium 336/3]|nr:hypothetical protein AD998_02050 [bacterium 336/3]